MISPQVIQELLTVRQVLHYLPASPSTEKGWNAREQQLFWDALAEFPQGPWTTIAEFIGTKSTRQAMTHGQKLRQKLNRWRKRLRRTPAAAAALAEDPMLLDDDVRASMVLNSVMVTSSALPVSSRMALTRNTSLIATSTTTSATTAAPTTLSVVTTTTSGPQTTATRPLDRHHGLYHFDSIPGPLHYNTRYSLNSRQLTHSLSDDLSTIAATSSGSAEADANFTELLMASFPPVPAAEPPYASMPYSTAMLQTSRSFNRTGLSALSTPMLEPMPSLPSPLVSSERLESRYRVRHNTQSAHRRSMSQPAAPTGAVSFYPENERYEIPQSMVDDLADVLWDQEQ